MSSEGSPKLDLTVVAPDGSRALVEVGRSPFRIGRLPDRELALKDARISRDHGQILLENGEYVIEDVGSRHGLYVNGEKIERAVLTAGDRIDFGVEDSYHLFVGDELAPQGDGSTPLLQRVAEMPAGGDATGNLSRLSAVVDVVRALESSGSVDDVLAAAVDAALKVTGAERGFLMLESERGELTVRIARDDQGRPLGEDDLRVPRGVISTALRARRDLFAMAFDPGVDPDAGGTVVALELRSVVCVPLVRIRLGEQAETRMLSAAADTLGVLYMDSRQIATSLVAGKQDLLQSLAIEISTVLENARLLEQERKRHHLERELRIARDIQQALLPPILPSDGWFVAAGSSEATFQVGGDYFDVIQLDDEHWAAVLADVSGKGVSAALLTSVLQGAFFSTVSSEANLPESVARINRYICDRARHARFATVFCCIANRSGATRWVNAGHCPGLLIRSSGELERLQPGSPPIGLFAEAEFAQQTFNLAAGDKLVIYSDGVSEAAASSHEQFGDERLEQFLVQHRQEAPDELLQGLRAEIAAFTKGAEQADDLTLLVLEYRGG